MYSSEFFNNELDIAIFSAYRYAKLTYNEYFKNEQNVDLTRTYLALTLSYLNIAKYTYNYQLKHTTACNHDIDEFLYALDVFQKMMASNIQNDEHFYWPGLAFEILKNKYLKVKTEFEIQKIIN